jgi:chromosome segregation protein
MHLDLTILVKDLSFFQEKLSKIQIELKKAKSELEVFEPNIKSITESLKVTKERAEAADKEVESLTTELADLVEEVNKIENAKNTIKNKLTNDIQTDNVEKRAEAYRQLLSTTKFELDDTKQKATKLQDEINVYTDTIEQLATKRNELMDISSKQSIRSAEIRVEIKNINDALENKSHLDTGVKTIIENKEALTGINGLVKDFLQVEDQYEKAILTALGKNINNIIVDTTDDAKIAVDFLKKNKAGKATFLPLDIIKPRGLKEEYYQVINGKNGFINTANKLITFDEKYQNIFNFLLGNIIISDDINNATILSQYTYQLYRVITLDGDIVAPGGVISGGFNKVNSLNSVNLKKKLTELEDEFEHIDNELINCRVELDKTNAE